MDKDFRFLRTGDTLICKKIGVWKGDPKIFPGDKGICLDTSFDGSKYVFLFHNGFALIIDQYDLPNYFNANPRGHHPEFRYYIFRGGEVVSQQYEYGLFEGVWNGRKQYLAMKNKI